MQDSQTAILRSRQDLRTIFDNSHDAIFIHALDGTIIDVSDRMLQMYRVSREEATTLSIVADYSSSENPLDLLPGWWERVLAGETVNFEWQAKRPHDGSLFNVE
ncbi:PAS domain-containing protein [bacterium]|nr:PAS domain-containing protein [bacterium]